MADSKSGLRARVFLNAVFRLVVALLIGQDPGQVIVRHEVVGIDPEQFLERGDGLVELLQLRMARPEIEAGGGIFRVQIDHPPVLFGGAPVVLQVQIDVPEQEEGIDIIRMLLEGLLADRQGLLRLPLFHVEGGDLLCEIGGSGIEAAGLFHLPDRLFQIFIHGQKDTQGIVKRRPFRSERRRGRLRLCGVVPHGEGGASRKGDDHRKKKAEGIQNGLYHFTVSFPENHGILPIFFARTSFFSCPPCEAEVSRKGDHPHPFLLPEGLCLP